MSKSKARKVLLVEPGFKTKFPPLGLMKISAYHKLLGDEVFFYKGTAYPERLQYTFWDRIYVSTLFTYHWDITVKTINSFKSLVDDYSRIKIGGILATLMPDDIWEETGIYPVIGLINRPHILDDNNEIIIDELVPDYHLFNDTEKTYQLIDDCYIGYSTRGCRNKCGFCGVPLIEPKYNDYIDISKYVNEIAQKYGEKQNLVLLDNNVLASNKFASIVNSILDLGFNKGAKFRGRQRRVDFNQGVDSRLINEEKMRLLSKISIHPLRIAFDNIKLAPVYKKCIELAAKFGINHLSNYLLYNYKDTPEDLWQRMKINIDLNRKLGLKIYSFPMKYIPLTGIASKDRKFISSPAWNRQYLRGVQRILNVLKGSVMTREDFFLRAFGQNTHEFIRILHMPEHILMNRGRVIESEEREWTNKYEQLSFVERKELLELLCLHKRKKELMKALLGISSRRIKNVLEFYLMPESQEQLTLDLNEN